MAEKPTQLAERMFALAGMKTITAVTPKELSAVLYDISRGLEAMAVAQRAIYIKLESLEKHQTNPNIKHPTPLNPGL
jgi:hypothetical protein